MDKTRPISAEPAGERKSFTSEFKQLAVARLKTCTNATALALELGVRRNLLYKWAKQLEASGPETTFRSPGRPAGEAESELSRLRRENTRLEMENAILKKAGAYFARRKR
jgi:transposase